MKTCMCGGKGWWDSFHGVAATWTPSVQRCPAGCNLTGYSNEVQRRLNDPSHVTAHLVMRAAPSEKPAAPLVPMLRLVK